MFERYENKFDLLLNSVILSCDEMVIQCKIAQATEISGNSGNEFRTNALSQGYRLGILAKLFTYTLYKCVK